MIEQLDADVLAIQEARSEQVREILAAHPRYVAIGAHRGDGRLGGEGVITLIDTDRFMIAEAGVFALSDEPDRIGSITWDNRYPRICAWSRLIDMETGAAVRVYCACVAHSMGPNFSSASAHSRLLSDPTTRPQPAYRSA